MIEYEPGFMLEQAIGVALNQDWTYDFRSPYEALEAWFQEDGQWPQNLQALIRDIDLLFATTPDAETRLAPWVGTGLRVDEIDGFLAAMRKRAVDGMADNAEPMRAP